MNYIENIYICLVAPILISILSLRGRGRPMMIFVFSGMTACLLSSYISTFVAAMSGMDYTTASITVTPVVEELMKLLPTLFYLLIFEPKRRDIPFCPIMIAVGFATLENVCYLVQNGSDQFFNLLIRGFGTGTMHMFCGSLTFVGIVFFWDKLWLRIVGTFGLLATAITYHGIYNMLVLQPGMVSYIGYLIPLVSVTLCALWYNRES